MPKGGPGNAKVRSPVPSPHLDLQALRVNAEEPFVESPVMVQAEDEAVQGVVRAIFLDGAEMGRMQQLWMPNVTDGATNSIPFHHVKSKSRLIGTRCHLGMSSATRSLEHEVLETGHR